MSKPEPPASHLLRLVKPRAKWETAVVVNDESSAAFLLASRVQHVTLVYTNRAFAKAAEISTHRAHTTNLTIDSFNCDGLPFSNRLFDLLLFYHCSHTFFDLGSWVEQARSILKPQGLLVVTTYLVPGTRLRGKKARRLRETSNYINAWHKLRDLQFREFYSRNQWEDTMVEGGFAIETKEIADKVFDFDSWLKTARVNNVDRIRLKAMLIQAPEKVREFLTPQFSGDRIHFHLPEITILAMRQANRD